MGKKRKKSENDIYINEEKLALFANKKTQLINSINKNNHNIPFNNLNNLKYKNKKSNSWFKIKKARYNDGPNLISANNIPIIKPVTKCEKITILPNAKQKEILLNWFEAYRKMYNNAIFVIRELINEKHKDAMILHM
jgi:hypothetical protein